MKQTITIEIPEGKTYKQTTDKNGNITIQYVDKESVRSKSWEEFCKNHPIKSNTEWCINGSIITPVYAEIKSRESTFNQAKGYLSTKEDAEGILALIQLIRLHDEWVGDWKPNWDVGLKYCINYWCEGMLGVRVFYTSHKLLCFPIEEMAKEFLECFKDLIEKAKKFI